ncbi:ABC transporter ATP-binding protein [Borrelia anserina BA2]|uniref:ABC transporter ATP-binding protein n=1 Tax=Borrelia anserina BA2 TaxID=1313293 RepID=W5STV5_BORAN|nr:ABC transporter ATP-binding protein [Borrelia anserina BA2]
MFLRAMLKVNLLNWRKIFLNRKNRIKLIKEKLSLDTVNDIVLKADNIVKKYGEKVAVNGVTIDIHRGEVVGLLGPNGAGKTTTFYTIVGFIRANSGRVLINSHDISGLNMYERSRLGVVYLPQEPSIFRELTVEDNILVALERREDLSQAERKIELVSLLKDFEIKRIQHQKAYTLSGGERRRTEIARALAVSPYFLLLDEPFAGIDPIAIGDIKNIIRILKSKNIGVLITDHNVRDAFDIIDRAYIIYQGQVLDAGNVDYIINSEKAKKLYLGEEFRL